MNNNKNNISIIELFEAISKLDKDTAINTAVINKNIEFLNSKIEALIRAEREYVNSHFELKK